MKLTSLPARRNAPIAASPSRARNSRRFRRGSRWRSGLGSGVVLDSPAILAVLFNERGSDEIMPLLEDLFYGQRDLASHYGLESLRKAVSPSPAPPEP